MREFEEKSHDGKEETLKFGHESSGNIRMLGSWIGHRQDLKNRKKRAGGLWAKIKPRLWKSNMSKVQQAKVVEACVESGLLFDVAVRTWYVSEIKSLQSWVDKCYRYIWSNKKGPPLIEMQLKEVNMQDVRNQLQVKSVRWKVEKRALERIGHVLRMDDGNNTKVAVLVWYAELENEPKMPRQKT